MLGIIFFYINLQPINLNIDSVKRSMAVSNLKKEP